MVGPQMRPAKAPVRDRLSTVLWAITGLTVGSGTASAEWLVRELPGASGSGPSLEMSYRSSGERFTLLCGGGASFVSFAPGYRIPAQRDGVFDGHYSVDNGPLKPIRWRITGTSAFVTARFADNFLADISGAAQVFIKFPGVEQTYDLTPLAAHTKRLRMLCHIGD
jgi:hypothetical protein